MIGQGVLRIASNEQLDAQEKAAAIDTEEQAPVLTGLAAHVNKCWQEARTAKDMIVQRLINAQLTRAGKYDDATLAQIREYGGSEEYARISANKCRVAESWIRDVYIGQTDKPWTLKPTPKPELTEDSSARIRQQVGAEFAAAYASTGTPPNKDLMSERIAELTQAEIERTAEVARVAASNMENEMQDQMVQGGWEETMGEFISDLVTYPAAILKAPVLRKKKTMEWASTGSGWIPQVQSRVMPEFERVDPFRAFPAPGASSPQDGYFIEHITLSRSEIYDLIGVEGFDENAIREVLDEYGRGGLVDWTNQYALSAKTIANGELYKTSSSANVTIDALEYHGPVQGKQLIEWGMDAKKVPDPDEDYEACVWMIGRWIIKAQLNYDPLGIRPYHKTSYEELPGAFWGFGLVDILEDMQGIANAGLRAMVNNMAFASGPQVGVNVDRMPAGEDLTDIHPLKIWQFNESQTGSNTKAIEFFQPESKASELIGVIEKAYEFADDFSLIPRWMASGGSSGDRTASGMSMKMDAANKGLKGVVSNIDVKILSPMLEALFNFNMLFNPDQSIKGDAKIVARGAVSLMQLETLQLRRNEFLTATNNPVDQQIMGLAGRAEILRATAQDLDLDINRIIPPRGAIQTGQPQSQPQGAIPTIGSGQQLGNGAAVTDNFSPNSMRSAS